MSILMGILILLALLLVKTRASGTRNGFLKRISKLLALLWALCRSITHILGTKNKKTPLEGILKGFSEVPSGIEPL